MRLTIPEPEITLYQDGFDKHDKLSRKPTGDKLSELVERIDDPLVIALDGAWGSGKSFFLKCWVGEHLKREKNTTQTVYFDAFKHDFLDDPLIALTGAIAERFDEADDTSAQTAWKKAKQVAPALGRALVRTGVSVGTAGLVTKADELADAAINSVSSELDGAVAEFWQRENGKRAAMAGFRQALVGLTKPDGEEAPTRKLVVVIDELDRCRPDYALSLLEIVKHFFNVDGVHFIFGVNLREFENGTRARYGQDVDAPLYLQKFLSVSLRLQNQLTNRNMRSVYLNYYEYLSKQMQIEGDYYVEIGQTYLKHLADSAHLSLRGIQQFARLIATTPLASPGMGEYRHYLLVGILFFKAFAPKIIHLIREDRLTWEELARTIRPIYPPEADKNDIETLSVAWFLCFSQQLKTEFWSEYFGNEVHSYLNSFDRSELYYLLRNYADVFKLE
jgi:hypothetical protein